MTSSAFVQKITTRLEQEKAQLEKQLAELRGSNGNGTVEWKDMGQKDDENAAEVTTFEENLSVQKNLTKSLDEVNEALRKIADGTYGRCVNCGKPIDEKRLEVFPAATAHTDCSSV